MKIYEGYVLLSELAKMARKSVAWGYGTKGVDIEYMGRAPVVKKETLPLKYKIMAEQCIELKHYTTFAEFSREIGRTKDYINVLENQKRKANKPPFESIKVGHYKLLKLSEDFISMIQKGLTPYKLSQKYDEDDYKHIIEMQGMKIGFY